jgi:hypothetical protein
LLFALPITHSFWREVQVTKCLMKFSSSACHLSVLDRNILLKFRCVLRIFIAK